MFKVCIRLNRPLKCRPILITNLINIYSYDLVKIIIVDACGKWILSDPAEENQNNYIEALFNYYEVVCASR